MADILNNSPVHNSYGLAIHTSSSELGLAIGSSDSDLRYQVWDLGRDLSAFLHQYLLAFIAPQTWSDLGFIAVAIGPGSFTGTRIGVVTARTLAQQLNLPLYGVSSLAAIAFSTPSTFKIAAIEMPAQRGEMFGAVYEKLPLGMSPIMADAVVSPDWRQQRSLSEAAIIEVKAGEKLGQSVASVWQLAYLDYVRGKSSQWSEVVPFYGQHPVD